MENLSQKPQKSLVAKTASLAVEVALIFAIPAAIAAIAGPKMDIAYETGKMWTIILILSALVISWALVIVRYKRAVKEIEIQQK